MRFTEILFWGSKSSLRRIAPSMCDVSVRLSGSVHDHVHAHASFRSVLSCLSCLSCLPSQPLCDCVPCEYRHGRQPRFEAVSAPKCG